MDEREIWDQGDTYEGFMEDERQLEWQHQQELARPELCPRCGEPLDDPYDPEFCEACVVNNLPM